MSDLISRQAALNAICGILTHGQALECERRINALPPAQLKTQLSEEDATSDCISRQAAIDAINNIMPTKEGFLEPSAVFCELFQLPSAQPEVLAHGEGELSAQPEQPILCGECKHYKQDSQGIPYCYKHRGYGWYWDDFCSYAERREG